MYKLLSGAKSVKQYRGDENLPEAKKGMKNCGCKHSRSKYKYQEGDRDVSADLMEYGKVMNPSKKIEENENLDYYIDYNLPKNLKPSATKTVKKNIVTKKDTVPTRTTIKKDTTPVQKKTYPTVSGEKKVYIEKTPVNKVRNTPATMDRAKEYFDNYGGEGVFPGNKKYQLVDGKMIITKRERWGKKNLGYDWEDLSDSEKDKVTNMYKERRRDNLQKEIDIMNKSSKYRKPTEGESIRTFLKGQETKELNDIRANVKKITSAIEGKSPYKYGTGALMIPEGSAIVTANGGKNKQAIAAYKKGNYKLLNKIIDDMPEDRVSKKQAGDKDLIARYKTLGELTGPLSEEQAKEFAELKNKLSETTYDLYDDKRIAEKFGQKYDVDKAKNRSSLKGGKLTLKEDPTNVKHRNRLRTDPKFFQEELKKGNVTIDKDGNIAYKSVGKSAPNKMEFLGTSKTGTLPTLDTSPKLTTVPQETTVPAGTEKGKENSFASNKRGGNFLQNIPSLAEIAARASILGQGIEGVPENYLRLGRYNYTSQLPATLREIQLAEQAGRETARDMVAGDAGRYLAQAGNLSAARMKVANEAVIQDTLARQDILNKNVDLGNVESQTNRALKDQYAALRAQARANYNEQLVGLGQRVDSAFETGREMANQREMDERRLNLLKTGNYKMDSEGNIIFVGKNGAKKLKTYKRK
jgi:hypothetical protein